MKKEILATTFMASLVLIGLNTNQAKAANINDQSIQQDNNSQIQNPTTSQINSTTEKSNLTDVNDYINKNKLPYSSVKDESGQSTFTAGKDYRYGKPEGIVVHETAEPNISAQQWADIFNQNWKTRQTYVHAFVDKDSVVQIAPTNKTVWGSGYYGNQRFIQVELCEENNEQDFAQSIQNDATYIANLLHQYNLKPSLADGNGQGTIWSHHDVTKYLGDTTHTDPDGYFALHNYSMQQFFNLIEQRYTELTPLYDQSKIIDQKGIVQINYSGKGKVAIWNTPQTGHQVVKYVNKNTTWKFFKVATINGHTWYNLGGNQWVDGNLTINLTNNSGQTGNTETQINSVSGTVRINYNGRGQVAIWDNFTTPHKVVKYVPKNSNWKIFKVANIDGHTWYNLGGNQWVDGNLAVRSTNDSQKTTNLVSSMTESNNSKAKVNNTSGVVRINYSGRGQVAIWDNFTTPHKVVKYVPKNSNWKIFKVANIDGHTWYNLGGNQWVEGQLTVKVK